MIVAVKDVTKRFRDVVALGGVSFTLRENTIYGLLGRNGAGKTTLMQILTGQQVATAGTVEVFGEQPYENDAVLARTCFVRESQRYPDDYRVKHALRAAALLFPNWDEAYAQSLVDDFRLPRSRTIKKLSRGMLSAVGLVIGLAARAPLTLFDEPYLGLDAAARQLFYDRLLADYAEHPRTVMLSTHLIDEVADLVEHVLVIDQGRLIVDEDADRLRGQVVLATGPADAARAFAAPRTVLHQTTVGPVARFTLRGEVDADARAEAERLGVTVTPVSLQQLVVSLTTGAAGSATSKETTP
ncbi:MAG: ABC transporter ATP-binding protein [Micromonosporaceae bacterium]|nr:ABC transporter ATP-binding protein [Micromonosporaceae bacterium]